MDTVELDARHIAFIHDEMNTIENDTMRHSSEREMARTIRQLCDELLG